MLHPPIPLRPESEPTTWTVPAEMVGRAAPLADAVKRPSHYRQFDGLVGRSQIETIDIVELVSKHYPPEIAGHIMQALQYLCRAPHKGTMQEDMAKAERYLTRAINTLAGKPSWERQT